MIFFAACPRLVADTATNAAATATGAAVAPTASLPDAGASVFRVFGSLIFVVAVFFAGVWLFKNWQRFSRGGKGTARLNVLEVKSLGQRQAVFVIGYQDQRFLVASTPGAISMLATLPNETPVLLENSTDEKSPAASPMTSFAEAFQQVLNRK